jgi:hypothetical protein
MKEYIEKLKVKLEQQLALHQEEKQPLRRLRLCKEATQEVIAELVHFTSNSGPANPEEVILYNKQLAPYFYAKLHYFNKCFDLEFICLPLGEEDRKRLYEHELKGIGYFFHRFSGFCQDYYSGNCDNDPAIYWSNGCFDASSSEEPALVVGSEVVDGRKLVALILANEQYRDYLLDKLRSDRDSPADASPTTTLPSAKWVKTKTDLAEVIYSLFIDKAVEVNGKPATLVYYQKAFEYLFGISFADLSVTGNKIRNRKRGALLYMEGLTKGLQDWAG